MKNLGKAFPFFHYTINRLTLLFFVLILTFFVRGSGGNESKNLVPMVMIKGGTFMMGSPEDEPERSSDETQHSVTVSSFYMSKYPITQNQYETIMGTENSDSCFRGANLPVENVTWYDTVEFCNKLSKAEGLENVYKIIVERYSGNGKHIVNATVEVDWSKNGYRLPTEAEWEYACRGDYPDKATETKTKLFGLGDGAKMTYEMANFDTLYPYDVSKDGYYEDRARIRAGYKCKTTVVGSYEANNYGLYGMHGNVWEWCWDWYGGYSSEAQMNPKGPEIGSYRVIRGGSWNDGARLLRSAFRNKRLPGHGYIIIGFRVVRS